MCSANLVTAHGFAVALSSQQGMEHIVGPQHAHLCGAELVCAG